jgi:hypothetical protein
MAAISISVGNFIFEQSWLAIGEESIYGLSNAIPINPSDEE